MAHRIYTTEGFVLSSSNSGEANKYFRVFTSGMGLITALASGIRYEHSKLRFHLQDYAHAQLSLVRGKEVWRIVGASQINNMYYQSFYADKKKLLLYSRINLLLKRLLHGEEKNGSLYDVLSEGFYFLTHNNMDKSLLYDFECILVLRILHVLGYVSEDESEFRRFQSSAFDKDILQYAASQRKYLVAAINESLKVSQL